MYQEEFIINGFNGIVELIKVSLYRHFLISGFAFLAIYFITIKTLRKIVKKYAIKFEVVKSKIKIPLFMFLLNLGLLLPVIYLSEKSWTSLVQKILTITLIYSVSWLLFRVIDILRIALMKRYDINAVNNLKARKVHTQIYLLERIINIIIVILAISIALMTFDPIKKVGLSIFASAGIASIIIGLASQKFIATLIAGLQIAITQPIRVDDVVIVEGEWGWVEEIYLTYVVVRIWDKRKLIMPTTYFIEEPFQNWTYHSSDIMGTVFLYTDYTVPFNELREELDRLLEDNELWDGNVKVMQVTDATEKTVEIRILVSATDSPTAWDLRVFLREKLIEFIQKNYPESLPKSRVEFKDDITESI